MVEYPSGQRTLTVNQFGSCRSLVRLQSPPPLYKIPLPQGAGFFVSPRTYPTACQSCPWPTLSPVMEMLRQAWNSFREHPLTNGLLPHLLTVAGFLLAFFAIARLMSQRKQPGNTFAWLLAIAFIPYVGVPLYLLLGGRKLRKLAESKGRLQPVIPEHVVEEPDSANFAARVFTRNGACPPVGGNSVRFLAGGEESYAALEQGILQAKESIHLMTFILGRDEVGKRIVALLAQRAREGIKVRLLLDAFGCF